MMGRLDSVAGMLLDVSRLCGQADMRDRMERFLSGERIDFWIIAPTREVRRFHGMEAS